MHKNFVIPLLVAMIAVSCGRYDEGALSARLDALEQRMEKFEKESLAAVTGQMESVRSIISAIRKNVFVSLVEEDDTSVDIYLTNGEKISIVAAGHSADMPVIGVKLGDDGHYYWTLNGKLLLASDGNPIAADDQPSVTGPEGNAGTTPEIRIENSHWILYYGTETQDLGPISETKVISLFSDVILGDNYVTFVMTDGTTLNLARADGFSLNLGASSYIVSAGSSQDVPYNYMCRENAQLTTLAPDGISVEVVPSEGKSGVLRSTFSTGFSSGVVLVFLVGDSGEFLSLPVKFTIE